MNFFRNLVILILTLFIAYSAHADSHDKEQNIVEKAKEINQKIKEKQALQNSNSASGNQEEPLPLNDPFVGDGSLGGGNSLKIVADTDEEKKKLSLFNYKLIGVITGDQDMFASLINENGEIINIGFNEELSPGVRLIDLNSREVIFDRGGESQVVINFKNQIIERKN